MNLFLNGHFKIISSINITCELYMSYIIYLFTNNLVLIYYFVYSPNVVVIGFIQKEELKGTKIHKGL